MPDDAEAVALAAGAPAGARDRRRPRAADDAAWSVRDELDRVLVQARGGSIGNAGFRLAS